MLQLATGVSDVSTNPTQFSRLFDQYHGLIFRTAYRITGNAADAEDVLQTIFLRLVRRESPVGTISEESYFRRAAVNASLDLLRSKRKSRSIPLDELPVEDAASKAEGHNAGDLRECMRRAFAGLSPRSAEIFALRYFEDFTNPEIAHMLGVSQVLVAVTLHRTRRQLQKEVQRFFGGKL